MQEQNENTIEETELLLTPEEIQEMSKILAKTLAQQLMGENAQVTIATCVSGYRIETETQITQLINLDMLASASAGVLDPLGQLRDWFVNIFNSVSSWIVSSIQGLMERIVTTTSSIINTVTTSISRFISDAILTISRYISDAISRILSSISNFISNAVSTISSAISGILSSILTAISGMTSTLSVAIAGVTSAISSTISSVASTIMSAITGAVSTISSTILGIISTLSSTISGIASTIISTVSGMISAISNVISSMASSIMSAIAGVTSTISNIISGIASAIMSAISGLSGILNTVASTIMGAINGAISTISNAISGIISAITGAISGAISAISGAISGIVTSIVNTITGFINTISATISGIAKTIMDAFNAMGKTIFDALSNLAKTISDTISLTAKGIMDGIASIGKGITDLWGFLVGAFQDVATKVGAGFDVIGTSLMGFVNAILKFPEWFPTWFREHLVDPLTTWIEKNAFVWLEDRFLVKIEEHTPYYSPAPESPQINYPKKYIPTPSVKLAIPVFPDIEVLSNPFKWAAEKVIGAVSGWLDSLWNALVGVFNTIVDTLKTVGEAIWKGITGMFGFISNLLAEKTEGIWKLFIKERSPQLAFAFPSFEGFVKNIYDSANTMTKEKAGEMLKPQFEQIITKLNPPLKIDEVTSQTMNLWGLSLGIMSIPFFGQIPLRLASWILKAMSRWFSELGWKVRINLRPFGIGVDTEFDFAKAIGASVYDLAGSLMQWLDEVTRGFIYGYTIWFSQPISKLINMTLRNFIPVTLPTENVFLETLRRAMPLKDFQDRHRMAGFFLAVQGYSDHVIESWIKPAEELRITVTDRFGTERTVPLSLMYDLPSASDVATMMVRDIFQTPEDFFKLYLARGMHRDVGALYYFLRFRYPPPEVLWQFTMRGISGLLWATLPDTEKSDIRKEIEAMKAIMPTSPTELNFQANTLISAFKTYMKWHDYFRGCVPEGELILGDNKPIETYEVGDHTLLGGTVEATYRKYYRGKAVKIKAHDILELKVTPEHVIPVMRLARKWIIENGKDNFKLVPVKIVYKHADEIEPAPKTHPPHYHEGDYLLVPILRGDVYTRELDLTKYLKKYTDVRRLTLPLDEDVAWFMGFYVAEGHSQDKYISVSQSEENEEIINKVCAIINKLGYKSVVSRHRGIAEIYIKSPILARAFIDWFEKGARNKKIPDFILHHKDRNIVKAFIKGYIVGDGCISNNSNEAYLYTVSKTLALQLQLLLLRLGYIAGVSYREKANGYMIRYMVHDHRNKLVRRLSEFIDFSESNLPLKRVEDYLLVPVSEVEFEDYEGSVYDLQVENDHFLVSNVVVHNSWIQGFTSDNLIYIDTLADIPTKIDQRWMVKWGLYELLSKRGVTLTSPSKEFASKVIEPTAKSNITLDLSNFSRTLQATGIHPYWIPITAVAETMNVLTEERTMLRTGVSNLFKEGFYDYKAISSMLSEAIVVSYKVAYFDMDKMSWTEGYINQPVMFLPAEQKIIQIRALMDRSLDILKEIQRDVSVAYQDHIIATEQDYEKTLTEVITHVNEFYAKDYSNITGTTLPDMLKLKYVKEYYEPYVKALNTMRNVYVIRRIRAWTQRWVGWIMYRVATGVAEEGDVRKLIDTVSKHAMLTDEEKTFLNDIMSLMYQIATREYIPTPTQLASMSEYIVIPKDLIEECFEARVVPEEWRDIWRNYISIRPMVDDIKSLLSSYRRALLYTKIPEDIENKIRSYARKINFTDEEMDILKLRVTLEQIVQESREYVPTPYTLGLIAEYVPITSELMNSVFDARKIPNEWRPIWSQFISYYPIKPEARSLLSAYTSAKKYGAISKEDFDKFLKELPNFGFTDKEIELITRRVELEETVAQLRGGGVEYIPSPSTLVTLAEYVSLPPDMVSKVFEARNIPKEWTDIWMYYLSIKPIADDVRVLVNAYYKAKRYQISLGEMEKQVLNILKTSGMTDQELSIRDLATQIEIAISEYTENKREYIPTPSTLASICEVIPEARQFFDEVMTARRVPQNWQEVWLKYVDFKPIIDEVKKMLTRVENLYEYFAISEDTYKEVLKSVQYLGWTDKEIDYMLEVSRYVRWLRAYRELIGDVDRMVTVSNYSPKAEEFALGNLYKMIDAMPMDTATKETIKSMWEQFIRNRHVKDEVITYVRDLVNLYVAGQLSKPDLEKELTWLENWGLSKYEREFWLKIADARLAKKLKIPVVFAE